MAIPYNNTISADNSTATTTTDITEGFRQIVIIVSDTVSSCLPALVEIAHVVLSSVEDPKLEEIPDTPRSFPRPRTMPWEKFDQFPVIRGPSRPRRRRRRMAVP